MPRKALASLNVVINAVTSPLFRGLAVASKRLIAFGAKMKAVGRSISMSFTMPFAMIGAAGAKMAIDFEQSMTKITTLVGTSAAEVNKLAAEVKTMAVETATPAKELADALFFIQSAGVKGAESMDALRVSAKGASMQMGDITDIASATTSIMTAYGHSAEKSGDLLHETLKQGKFDAAEFMNKIGQVIPTAAAFGISFEEMGAAVATMSKISGDASGSLTAVNQVMLKLMTPGEQQKKILKSINMEYDDLNAMMKDSLMGTLQHLFTELEGNDEMLTKVFGGARAVKGAFATAGLQAETYAEVLDGMNTSMGNVEEGFQTQAQTVGFKMKQSFEKLKLAAMEMGAVLMPLFSKMMDVFTNIAKAFTELDEGKKKLIMGAAALVAFSGPLMTLAGGLVTVLGMILSPIGLVIVALVALFKVIYDNWGTVKKYLVNFVNYWIDLYNESTLFKVAVQSIIVTFKVLWLTAKLVLSNIWTTLKAVASNTVKLFTGVGNVLKGAATKNYKDLVLGITQTSAALKGGMKETFDGITDNMDQYAEDVTDAYYDTVDAITTKKKIEFVSEKQVQAGIDNLKTLLGDKFQQVKDYIASLMGGSSLLVPEVGGEGGEGGEGPEDDGTEEALEKKKTLLQKYLEWAATGYEGLVGKISDAWADIANIAGAALNAIGGLWAAEAEKENTILANQKSVAQETYDADLERETLAIENSSMNQKAKDDALLKLKEKFDGRKSTMDKTFADKEAALKLKQGQRDKKMKIAQAIMGTASAIVQALTAGPIAGPILAAFVGGLGAAQVAAIASTPVALAKGGLAFGPTQAIVGDNPGAANDPEVIAPLSKLKGMMGGGTAKITLDVEGMVKGTDIWLSNDETTTQRERYI